MVLSQLKSGAEGGFDFLHVFSLARKELELGEMSQKPSRDALEGSSFTNPKYYLSCTKLPLLLSSNIKYDLTGWSWLQDILDSFPLASAGLDGSLVCV